ncbi:MAG: cell envelope integrity protein TolA, partial [Burkholderiaceae bacterium]
VKGTGELAIDAIVREREAGGPFRSLFDFVRRAEPPPPTEADIALESARKQEQERKAREEAQRKAELKKAEQKKADDKKAAERKEQERREQERKLADDKKRKDDERKVAERKREADAQKQREALRDEQLRRMQGLAGATGGEQSTGSAQRSAGPSASYAGRIVARVKPNIVFTDTVSGNPEAEVEVRAAPDGTIVGKRVVKSSGVKAWDEAVLRALDRTEVLPRDVDGRIPSTMILVFRPRD